jgi:hypothetical protein
MVSTGAAALGALFAGWQILRTRNESKLRATFEHIREIVDLLKPLRDREAVLEAYANITVEALEGLSPEERNKLYKILTLRVVLRDDGTPEVSGVFCGDLELPGVGSLAERNAIYRWHCPRRRAVRCA